MGGDTWEYQSLSVNIVKGHGYKFGEIVPFDEYMFQYPGWAASPETRDQFRDAGADGGKYQFLRTPGYPVFLAAIYKIAGVSPLIVKRVQLLLLIFIAAFLPFLGRLYWKGEGEIAGHLGGITFLIWERASANVIMTEPLIMFIVFLLLLGFSYWKAKMTPLRSSVFGLLLGLSLLVKASLIFLPLLFVLYGLVVPSDHIRSRPFRNRMIALSFVALGFFLPLSLWSHYATTRNDGNFIFLSTQSQMILDTNNEYMFDGRPWSMDWRTDPDAFYNQPEVRHHSDAVKVLLFYRQNLSELPFLISNKIYLGFKEARFLHLALLLLIAVQLKIKPSLSQKPVQIPIPIFILFLNFLFIFLIFSGEPRFVSVLRPEFAMMAFYLLLI
ncbi:MAG: glycosyltransferase family 39 protein [Candidatus Lindowbacteria bacterium]|nr:glycosyltransferase family 39 protein [Candidatus Lindowbacteria bacterium]